MSLKRLEKAIRKKLERNDPAHDYNHIMRVLKNAKKIAKKENINMKVITAAVLLHDIISYPKSDPRSKKSSTDSAKESRRILKNYNFTQIQIDTIADAIRDHSFSRGVIPSTIEGKILQDADRLDALGAIGIARTFSTGGIGNRPFYNSKDPFCERRVPDDKSWTVDHFYKKLLLLEKTMNTNTGRIEAKKRIIIMKKFLDQMKKEI